MSSISAAGREISAGPQQPLAEYLSMNSEYLSRRTKESNLSQNGETWSMAELCVFKTSHITDARSILAHMLAELSHSEAAHIMIREAAQDGWRLGFDALGKHDFHLDVPARHIILDNKGLDAATLGRSSGLYSGLLISMTRALRDVWQEKRHGGFDEHYTPESVLLLERVRAADCDVLSVLVGWQLREEDHIELWRHLLGSEESDLAMAFANIFEKEENMSKALNAAFRQWFKSADRINGCDHEVLEYMDDILMGNMQGTAFGKKRAHKACVEILSCLPDKTPYLRGSGDDILRDPLFAGLCDPINQTHFLQIIRDAQLVIVQNVPFRDAGLAAKIFPGGLMTPERQTDAARNDK